jgi:hypothetical protein
MKWLIPLVAAGAAAGAGVFFWLRKPKPRSAWSRATDATSSVAKSAAEKASSVAAAAAGGVKGAVTD